jgi:hypothetical protein
MICDTIQHPPLEYTSDMLYNTTQPSRCQCHVKTWKALNPDLVQTWKRNSGPPLAQWHFIFILGSQLQVDILNRSELDASRTRIHAGSLFKLSADSDRDGLPRRRWPGRRRHQASESKLQVASLSEKLKEIMTIFEDLVSGPDWIWEITISNYKLAWTS